MMMMMLLPILHAGFWRCCLPDNLNISSIIGRVCQSQHQPFRVQGVGAARHLTIKPAPQSQAGRRRPCGLSAADDAPGSTRGIDSGDGSSKQQQHQRQQASKQGLFEGSYMGFFVHEIWVALQEEGGHLGGEQSA
eukprot:201462-Pelagomonas_calceolata.AAC.5